MQASNTRGHGVALIIATLSLVIGGPAVASCASAQAPSAPAPVPSITRSGTVVTVDEGYTAPWDARPGDIVNVRMIPTGDIVQRCFHMGGRLVTGTCHNVDF